MRKKFLDFLQSESRNTPNKFTTALGEKIREARIEAHLSQGELAENTYLKQSTLSKIESGTREISAEDLLYFSYALDKPINYFFPKEFTQELGTSELLDLEEELLINARKLNRDDLRKLIAQIKAIANMS